MSIPRKRKNLILITCDALRADYLGLYCNNRKISPHIDRLGGKSIVFDQAFSTGPNTPSSFPSLFTGSHPESYGQVSYGNLLEHRRPIAEILQNERYVTGAFHSNPYLSQIFGYDRGFDFFSDQCAEANGTRHSSMFNLLGRELIRSLHSQTPFAPFIRFLNKSIGILKRFENFFHFLMRYGIQAYSIYARASEVTEEAKKFITSHMKETFFLWVHYMDPHTPLLPPTSYIEKIDGFEISRRDCLELYRKQVSKKHDLSDHEIEKLKALYSAEIQYVDEEVGHFIEYLETNNLIENTTIALTADHGEEFNEHGDLLHKEKLYDELLHVPLLVWDPDLKPKRIRTPVSLIDLSPTLLHLLDVEIPQEMQGHSLLPLIKGESRSRSKIISEVVHTERWNLPSSSIKIALRDEQWKLIHNRLVSDELYNLKEDPKETVNLINEEKQVARKMLKTLRQHLASRDPSKLRLKNTIKKKARYVKNQYL